MRQPRIWTKLVRRTLGMATDAAWTLLRVGRNTSKSIVSACVDSGPASGCAPVGCGPGSQLRYDGCVVISLTSHRQLGKGVDATVFEVENKVA